MFMPGMKHYSYPENGGSGSEGNAFPDLLTDEVVSEQLTR